MLVHRIREMVCFELGKEIEKDVFGLSMIAHDKTINIFLFSSTCEKKLVNSGVMFAKLCKRASTLSQWFVHLTLREPSVFKTNFLSHYIVLAGTFAKVHQYTPPPPPFEVTHGHLTVIPA